MPTPSAWKTLRCGLMTTSAWSPSGRLAATIARSPRQSELVRRLQEIQRPATPYVVLIRGLDLLDSSRHRSWCAWRRRAVIWGGVAIPLAVVAIIAVQIYQQDGFDLFLHGALSGVSGCLMLAGVALDRSSLAR